MCEIRMRDSDVLEICGKSCGEGWFWWDRYGKVVVCEILELSVVFLGICCSFEWLAVENTVDFGVRKNWEVFGEWVREKETGIGRKARFALIVEVR